MNNNQNNEKEIFNAACRSDFYTFMQKAFAVIDGSQEFMPNWHMELLCDKLEQCAEKKIKRLIINIPPRNLKSHCASICLPAYILGHDPSARIICVSYAQDLASKLSRGTRKLMDSEFYKNFSAQYQQRPIPEKGNIIDFELFKYYDVLPQNGTIFQSWDVAVKDGVNNDYSICITAMMRGGQCFITDITRAKMAGPDLENLIICQKNIYLATHIIIEDTSVSEYLISALERRGVHIIRHKPKYDKKTRANNASFSLKAGRIFLPKNATWLEDFKSEILSFPCGKHDDQVDAFSQLVKEAVEEDHYQEYISSNLADDLHIPRHLRTPDFEERILDEFEKYTGVRDYLSGFWSYYYSKYGY